MSKALKDILKDKVSYKMKMKRLNEMIKDFYPDIRCTDSNTNNELKNIDYTSDIQYVKASADIVEIVSGHLSGHLPGHECPDRTKSNGINGQSGQSKVEVVTVSDIMWMMVMI
jgi:hypothetical protein